MLIETRKCTDLKPAKYNPRKDLKPGDYEYEQILNSIEHFGYIDPIIINSDNTIISGHQRLKVLMDIGQEEVSCSIVTLDKINEKALNIAMNKIGGSWDEQKLEELLREIVEEDPGMSSLTGFNHNELEEMLGTEVDPESLEEDEVPEVVENFSKPGDVWFLGVHRLYVGDSTEAESVDRLFGKYTIHPSIQEKYDLFLTDPPYNIDYHSKNKGLSQKSLMNDNMKDGFYDFLLDSFIEAERKAKEGTSGYVFHNERERVNFTTAFIDSGFEYKQTLIWVKPQFNLSGADYQPRHECVLYGHTPGTKYFINDRCQDDILEKKLKTMTKEELVTIIESYNSDVIYEDRTKSNDLHPTMKPIKLLARLIVNSSKPGAIVFDPFLGSGSTIIAADKTKRICYGIELDPHFCDITIQRYMNLRGDANVMVFRDGNELSVRDVK